MHRKLLSLALLEERYILQGQRMAWERAHEIRVMMLLEAARP